MAPVFPLRIKLRQRRTEKKDEDQEPKPVHWRKKMQTKNPEKYQTIKERDILYSKLRNVSLNEEERQRQRDLTRERVRLCRLKKKEAKEAEKATSSKEKSPKSNKQKKKEKEEKLAQKKKCAEQKRQQRAAWSSAKRREVNLKQRIKRRENKEELQMFRRQKYENEKKKVEEERQKREEKQEEERKKQEEKQEEERQKQEEKQEEERKKKAAEEEQKLTLQIQQLANEALINPSCSDIPTPRSNGAKRKSLSRARAVISTDPRIYADTVCDLLSQATPKKKHILEQKGLKMSKSDIDSLVTGKVAQELKSNRHKRDKKTRLIRRGLAATLQTLKEHKQQKAAKGFYTTPKLLKRLTRDDGYKNPFSIKPAIKTLVRGFYSTKAVQLPNKKDISKKTLEKTAVLPMSVSALFADFKKAYPEVNIKSSSFFMLRPKHIKLMGKSKLRGCLCEYCTNLELKISEINKLNTKFKSKNLIKDIFHLTRLTMCNKPEHQAFHDPECYQRQCTKCGVKLLEAYFKPLLEEVSDSYKIQWSRWQLVKCNDKAKMMLISKEGTIKQLIAEMYEEVEQQAAHLHNWLWQHSQYTQLSSDPPPNTVIGVLDFAENYACLFQDEVQAAHWAHEQATVHPIVCIYRCKCHTRPITHSMIYISDDRKHDYHAVNHFFAHCHSHLTEVHKLQIDRFYRFSDGCAAQYKSKGPFFDIIQSDIPTEHHYFGSRHGKGPSDGESAVVKQYASTAVRSGRASLPTPHALYTYTKDNLTRGEVECMPFRREFVYVPSTAIIRDRPAPKKAVKGTRKIHCLKKDREPLTVAWKVLSCFCQSCLTNNGACINSKYTGAWTTARLEVPDVTPSRQDSSMDKQSETQAHDMTQAAAPECETTPLPPSSEDKAAKTLGETSTEAAETLGESSTEGTSSFQPAFQDFVTVRVPVQGKKKKSEQFFVAKVTSIEGNDVRVQYMMQRGELYTWPAGEAQYYLHPRDDIVRKLPSPEPFYVGRRLFFKFP